MKTSYFRSLVGFGFVASALSAQAVLLVEYTFTGSVVTPATTATGFTASAVSASSGVTIQDNQNLPVNNLGADASAPVINVIGFQTAVANDRYFGFTLQNNSGTTVNLSEIAFDYAPGGTSGPRGFELRYSLDGFVTFVPAGAFSGTSAAVVWDHFSFNLAGDLTDGSIAEFRFLGLANATGNGIRFDNITVDAIPEPSSFALLGGASLLGLVRRRRAGS